MPNISLDNANIMIITIIVGFILVSIISHGLDMVSSKYKHGLKMKRLKEKMKYGTNINKR